METQICSKFWDNTHTLSKRSSELFDAYVPPRGACIHPETGKVQEPLQIFLACNRVVYDLHNNGWGNDYAEMTEYISNRAKLLLPFVSEEEKDKFQKAITLLDEYTREKEEEKFHDSCCDECGGTGEVENWRDDEDAEPFIECSNCEDGRIEFETTDWLHHCSIGNLFDCIDVLIVAAIKYLEQEIEKGNVEPSPLNDKFSVVGIEVHQTS